MDTSFDKKNFIENFKHNCDRVKIKKFIKGDTITTYIEKRNQLCIVLSGEVNLIRYDINGNKIVVRAREELAIAFQHEIDHLNGILFIDKVTNDIEGIRTI